MSSSNFGAALALVLVHEGGYVNHPDDPGGATNKGVTQAVYDAFRRGKGQPVQSVRHITTQEVGDIYRFRYWAQVCGDDLPAGVDYVVFDFAVNSGVDRSSRYLQRAVDALDDGKIGPNTLAKVRAHDPKALIDELCDRRMTFLRGLRHWPTFAKGWTRRVTEARAKAKGMVI